MNTLTLNEYNRILEQSHHYSDIIFDHYYYPIISKIIALENLFQKYPDLVISVFDHEIYYSQQEYNDNMTIEHSCLRHIMFENEENQYNESQVLAILNKHDEEFFSLVSGIEVGWSKKFDDLTEKLTHRMQTFLSPEELNYNNRIEKYKEAIDNYMNEITQKHMQPFIEAIKNNHSYSHEPINIYGQIYNVLSTDMDKIESDYNQVNKNAKYKNDFLMQGIALNILDIALKNKEQLSQGYLTEIYTNDDSIKIVSFAKQNKYVYINNMDMSHFVKHKKENHSYKELFSSFPPDQTNLATYLFQSAEFIKNWSGSFENAKSLAAMIEKEILNHDIKIDKNYKQQSRI